MELWERRRSLGREILAKRRLYLDLRFWNDFCDAELGLKVPDGTEAALRALRSAVRDGDVVCPVECYAVREAHSQRLGDKLCVTLGLFDELSSKTAMVMPFERVFLEFLRFSQGAMRGVVPAGAPADEMWTRPMFVVGHRLPNAPPIGLPAAVEAHLQAEFVNACWAFGFAEIFDVAGRWPAGARSTASVLNAAKTLPEHLFPSYEATYRSEVLGSLDAYSEQLADVAVFLFRGAGGDADAVSMEERQIAAARLKRLLNAAFRKHDLTRSLPSVHIGATLYARMQWDRRRLYKENDVFDFAHAEAALPYCSGFATDGPLAALLHQAGLDARYGCDLLTDAIAIQNWVSQRHQGDASA